ncbi:unnamed protein product, partial [Didymodactylos carnosus]
NSTSTDTNTESNPQTTLIPSSSTLNNTTEGSNFGTQSPLFLSPSSTSLPSSFRLNYTNNNPNILRLCDPNTIFKYSLKHASELQGDFYLNLVDWSSTNILAVGLNASVYLWNANTSNVTRLCDLQSELDKMTSAAWSDRGQFVAVGTHKGIVQIWQAQSHRKTILFPRHTARVGALA